MEKRKLNIIALVIQNGSLILTAVGAVITMYMRFVAAEHQLAELKQSIDRLNVTVNALSQELQTEKSNSVIMSLRLSVLERQDTNPRLFK